MPDNRPFYDEEVPMCRECGYIECSHKYCTRVTHLIRIKKQQKKMEDDE